MSSQSTEFFHIVLCVCSDDQYLENFEVYNTQSEAFAYLSAISKIPINDIKEAVGSSDYFVFDDYKFFHYLKKKVNKTEPSSRVAP